MPVTDAESEESTFEGMYVYQHSFIILWHSMLMLIIDPGIAEVKANVSIGLFFFERLRT